jgi:DNA (cytosine-5)-methyltransferase 1
MSDLPHGQHLPLGLDSTEDMRMVRDGSVGVRPAAVSCVDVCPTLRAGGNSTGGDRPPGTDVDTADSLITIYAVHGDHANGDGQVGVAYSVLPFDTTQITSASNYSRPAYGDPCHPLAAGAHPPAVAIEPALYSIMPMNSGKDYKARVVDVAQPLMAGGPVGGNQGGDFVMQPPEMAVRRLMPVECERLQGFPDNWTHVPIKPVSCARQAAARADTTGAFTEIDGVMWAMAADGPRYKQCGNSMATNVMHWIGARINAALTATADEFDGLLGHNGGPALDDDFEALLA